jgi:hypothetical protein
MIPMGCYRYFLVVPALILTALTPLFGLLLVLRAKSLAIIPPEGLLRVQ